MRVRFSVRAMMSGFGLCNSHDETPVLNAFQSNKAAGEFLYPSRLAMHNEDFQARVMVDMCMTGRDHQFVACVLKLGQFFRNAVARTNASSGSMALVRKACERISSRALISTLQGDLTRMVQE